MEPSLTPLSISQLRATQCCGAQRSWPLVSELGTKAMPMRQPLIVVPMTLMPTPPWVSTPSQPVRLMWPPRTVQSRETGLSSIGLVASRVKAIG
ncbi:hypothetical protein VV02_09850 [Luteipulveratus mongoliensis]|uniref:Uncharacterized protein n=1 Tax=Luteipulveratus mongoliensis TaxID=571913 RepID=A0A0K1JHA7_9MICO|nr:hypothetical protein VV02_09850 [Luteipulveratus mongoliensis]